MNPERWQRIAAIFDEVIDEPAETRMRVAERLCAGDSALLREVEALLRADSAGVRFEGEVRQARDDAAESWSEQQTSEAMPPSVGPWRLEKELGHGGMGVVYLAHRADGQFEQHAALKLIRRELDSDGVLPRFLRERQILARLENAHIARLLDGGVTDDGRPYFAMEFVPGIPILLHCAEQRMSLEARLRLFIDVCGAVQFAHTQLIVHSDIKPSNILVTKEGHAKLLDFGIAKVLDESDHEPALTSGFQYRPLTPGYAAPEQLRGEAVTTAVDVYALGNLLYELLTGRASLPASATTSRETALRIRETSDPELPSKAASAQLPYPARRLRGDLDTIILTALQREPQHRYATAQAFAEDLNRYLSGQPIQARRQSAAYRFTRFAGRHRIGMSLGTVAIAGLMTTTALSIYGLTTANLQTARALDQAQRAETTSRFLADVFGQVSPDRNKGQPITAMQLLEAGEQDLDSESIQGAAAKPELLALLGRLYRDIGDRAHGKDLIARALSDSATMASGPSRARILLAAAASESEDKETFDVALAHAREAVNLLTRSPDADPRALAEGHIQVAYALRRKGLNEEAAETLRMTLASDSKALGSNDDIVAEQNVQLGIALSATGRFDTSQHAFDQALALYDARYGAQSVHSAHARDALAGMLYDKGDLAGAEREYRTVLDIHRRRLGPLHHDTLVGINNLLRVLETRGEFAAALVERQKLVQSNDASGEMTPTDRANTDLATSIDYIETSQLAQGEQLIRQALGVLRDAGKSDGAWYAYGLEFLAYVLPLEGKYTEAEEALRSALRLALASTPPDTAAACRLRDSLSWVLDLEHHFEDALRLSRQVDTECVAKLPPDSKQLPTFLADLSAAELDSGNKEVARQVAERALAAARRVYPPGYYRLGVSLLALGRADLANAKATEAEALLKEALAVRQPPYADEDPRMLEVRVELVRALTLTGQHEEAAKMREQVESLLAKSPYGYARDLRARLPDL